MAWLYKQTGSKYWWIGYRANGRQYLKSTKEQSRAKAEKILAQYNSMVEAQRAEKLTKEFYHALTNTPNVRLSLKRTIGDWLNECHGSTAEDTFARYNDVAQAFLTFTKAGDDHPALQDISTAEVQGFLDSVRAKRAVGTANLYRRILSGFFLRSAKLEIIKSNPAWPVRKFKASRHERSPRRAFTLAEIVTMHSKAPDDFWRYMILGGFFTGMRMGDLISAVWSNFDLSANVLRITSRKTSTTLSVPLASRFREMIAELRVKAGRVKGSDYVWPVQAEQYDKLGAGPFSNEFFDEVLLPCGLVTKRTKKKTKSGRDSARAASSVSFHCIRHAFVSTLKLTGAHQSTAKELAGHSSDEVNDIYTHTPEAVLVDAIGKLDDALKALPDLTK